MKNLKKISRNEMKTINGGVVATHCTSNAGCGAGMICLACVGQNCGNLGTGICI